MLCAYYKKSEVMQAQPHALDHLSPESMSRGAVIPVSQHLSIVKHLTAKLHQKPKSYRIMLHSEDRIAGLPTMATFDLGDTAAAWSIQPSNNLDAVDFKYEMKLDSFYLSCQNAIPAVIEIYGLGFPYQSQSYDSKSCSPSELIGVAAGAANASMHTGDAAITLREAPSGRVTIKLVTRDYGDLQAGLDTDQTVRWHAVLSLRSV